MNEPARTDQPWLRLDKRMLLVHPITERHLFPWRRLATVLGADHKAVQRWHAQGIDLIVSSLNGR